MRTRQKRKHCNQSRFLLTEPTKLTSRCARPAGSSTRSAVVAEAALPYVLAGPLDWCSFLPVAEVVRNPVLRAQMSSRLPRNDMTAIRRKVTAAQVAGLPWDKVCKTDCRSKLVQRILSDALGSATYSFHVLRWQERTEATRREDLNLDEHVTVSASLAAASRGRS